MLIFTKGANYYSNCVCVCVCVCVHIYSLHIDTDTHTHTHTHTHIFYLFLIPRCSVKFNALHDVDVKKWNLFSFSLFFNINMIYIYIYIYNIYSFTAIHYRCLVTCINICLIHRLIAWEVLYFTPNSDAWITKLFTWHLHGHSILWI